MLTKAAVHRAYSFVAHLLLSFVVMRPNGVSSEHPEVKCFTMSNGWTGWLFVEIYQCHMWPGAVPKLQRTNDD